MHPLVTWLLTNLVHSEGEHLRRRNPLLLRIRQPYRPGLVGVVLTALLPEALRFVGLPDAVAHNPREIIYGLMLAVLMYSPPARHCRMSTRCHEQ